MAFDPYTFRPKVRPAAQTLTLDDAEEGIDLTLTLRELTAPEEARAAEHAETLCEQFLGNQEEGISPTRVLPAMMDSEGNPIAPDLTRTLITTCAALEAMQPPWVKGEDRYSAVDFIVMRHVLPQSIRKQIDAFVLSVTKKASTVKNDSSAAEATTRDSSAPS